MNKNILTLYHYSNTFIPEKINPKLFGANSYTSSDVKACGISRSFFYLKYDNIPEYYLKGLAYLYTVNIYKKLLYDLKEDKSGLILKFKGNIPDILWYIRDRFAGAIYSLGNYDVVILFKAVKYNRVIKRERNK